MMQAGSEFELQDQLVYRWRIVEQGNTAIEVWRMLLTGAARLAGIVQRQ
jgi:hypothetical protein